jgi:hypothetical protein
MILNQRWNQRRGTGFDWTNFSPGNTVSAMNPRYAFVFKLLGVLLVVVLLALLFPSVMEFVELGARELKYLWWLVLLLVLALWLVWGLGRKKK